MLLNVAQSSTILVLGTKHVPNAMVSTNPTCIFTLHFGLLTQFNPLSVSNHSELSKYTKDDNHHKPTNDNACRYPSSKLKVFTTHTERGSSQSCAQTARAPIGTKSDTNEEELISLDSDEALDAQSNIHI